MIELSKRYSYRKVIELSKRDRSKVIKSKRDRVIET